MASSHETAPLLVDPPIDDESYRREARTFPSDEQKHLMFASHTITILFSRFTEIISTLLMALSYLENLLPITVFSFLVLASSSQTQAISYSVARLFKNRLYLLATSILIQRVGMFAFAYLILYKDHSNHWFYRLFVMCGLTLSIIFLKTGLYLYQITFKRDWLQILSNGKDSIRVQFEKSMHAVSVILQLILPVSAGILVASSRIIDCAKIMMFISIIGLIFELSLIWKLYSTCYALHLSRSAFSLETVDQISISSTGLSFHPMFGVLTTPSDSVRVTNRYSKAYSRPWPRIYSYVRRKPIPVSVTFGVILINISLITIGPHMVWYLLRQNMNPVSIGVFKLMQTLISLHPAIPAPMSFALIAIGAATSVLFLGALSWHLPIPSKLSLYLFASSVIIARSGVPMVNVIGDQFVEDYLADEEVHKVYKENAAWLRTFCELSVHILTAIFPFVDQFIFPIGISAALMFIGRAIVLKMVREHWKPES